jgi:molybdate transport system ATP-binding protein
VLNQNPPDARRICAKLLLSRGPFTLQVELDLPGSGITILFGPSGSGKTTCLRALAGLDRARGSVSVCGQTWQDDERGVFLPTHRRALGYVFQDPSLFAHLTVRGNLEYGRRRSGSPPAEESARSLIALLGIEDLLDRRPDHLSGGERQRVAIARALLAGPRLLLMDEPLASLDVARKTEVLPYLERLRDESSIPIVYVSHSLDEVARLANHLVLLEGGRLLASGPATETLARLDLPTALYTDAGVVVETRVAAHDDVDNLTRLDMGGESLWVTRLDRPMGATARVRILARDVSLAREAPGPSSILNVFAGHVQELKDSGPDRVNVRLSVGASGVFLLARITRRSRDALGLAEGLTVHALVKSVALVT